MKLSIIIVVYRSEAVIFDCLDSINRYNDLGADLEVILVDNETGSTLGDKLQTSRYSFCLKFIRSDGNKGFGAGNNIGVFAASSDIVLFLNPDTLLMEFMLRDVCDRISKNPNEICGFALMDKSGKRNNSYSFFYDSFVIYRALSIVKSVSYYAPIRWEWLNRFIWPWGAAFALSKDAFLAAGGFDERIFLCNEEPDLLKRLPNRSVVMLEKRIIHLEGHGTPVSEDRYYHYFRAFRYYQEKYSMRAFDRMMWKTHIRFLSSFYSLFFKDESHQNYARAYRRLRAEL